MHHWSVYGQRYDQMPEADILAEDSTNLVIGYADIQKVFFHAYDTSSSGNSNDTVSGGKFVISLNNGEKFQFTHQQHHNSAIRQTLQNLFGNKLKYRH